MTRIVVDASTYSRLAGTLGPVEVCNERGESAGVFRSAQSTTLQVECPLSEEELAQLDTVAEGRSLKEIQAELEIRP